MPGSGLIASAWYISGTISARPPRDTAMATRTASRPMFFSSFPCAMLIETSSARSGAGGVGVRRDHRIGDRRVNRLPRLPDVPAPQPHAAKDQQPAEQPAHVVRIGDHQRLDE